MSRKILNMCLLASLLLVASIFFLYRGTNWPLGVEGTEALGAFAVLLIVNIALFLYERRASHANSYTQKSILLGLFIGLLWTVEISMNNILYPKLPARDILDDLFWTVVALIIFIASIRFTWQTNQIYTGVVVGFWSGFSSGAVACLTGLLFIVFGMQFLVRDPLNITEWSARGATTGTPNIAVYFAYQTLAGSLLHLIILGMVMGTILGIIGGILGKVGNYIGQKMTTINIIR